MSNVFYLSDLHMGQPGILKYRKEFLTIQEHDEVIIANWNAVVRKRDVVWVLGDAGDPRVYARMNGTKYLVTGNHDLLRSNSSPILDKCHRRYFERIEGCVTDIGIKGFRVVATHIPIHPQEVARWHFNIHGHTHRKPVMLPGQPGEQDLRYVSMCCEPWDYAPVPREELTETLHCRQEVMKTQETRYKEIKELYPS